MFKGQVMEQSAHTCIYSHVKENVSYFYITFNIKQKIGYWFQS